MTAPKKVRIGDLLVDSNVISHEQLKEALSEQKKSNLKLGKILIDLGFVEENKLLGTLAKQLDIPFLNLSEYDVDPKVVTLLPESLARRFRAIALDNRGDHFLVGMLDPSDLFAFDELSRVLGKPIKLAIVQEQQLLNTIDRIYRKTEQIKNLAGQLNTELAEGEFDIEQLTVAKEDDAPIVKLLKSIFEDAVQVRASDIHIEPEENCLRIRHRVDGTLQEHIINQAKVASALVQRLKLMAHLDISEKRLPQDGRFNIRVKEHSIDVRMSTMPVQYGESVVMRLLDQSGGRLSLNDVGMPTELLEQFRALCHSPHGIILVTGPTGSGKTTTLYGALSELNQQEKKIITVEDPVEYRLPRINQVQIHEKIGLSFSQVLRAALRQDPDIVMVGEIRDYETAEIALRAAMTGHLVLSTLHTNDAVSSALRLVDMGAEGYLVASALKAIVAQRLVRRVCVHCKTEYKADDREQSWLASHSNGDFQNATFYHGEGCSQCQNTGYRGRIGIYELLVPNKDMLSALRAHNHDAFVKGVDSLVGFQSLTVSAMAYAAEGITSLEEVFRVTETVEA